MCIRDSFLTRYEDIYHVLRNNDIFLRGPGKTSPLMSDPEALETFKEGWPKRTVLGSNPPDHRRYRDMVDHFFSVLGAEKQTDLITGIVNDLIDKWIDDGEVEYVKSFAEPLPSMVITIMMGFPLEDLQRLKVWSEAWVAPFSLQLTPEEERQAARHMVYLQVFWFPRFKITVFAVTSAIFSGKPISELKVKKKIKLLFWSLDQLVVETLGVVFVRACVRTSRFFSETIHYFFLKLYS